MTNREVLRIGSRGSDLALWQARWVQNALQQKFPALQIDITIIKTKGDRILDSPLSTIGDKGLFTRDIEDALLKGSIDLAVHSLKDLPTVLPRGLGIGAMCEREDVRDVFIPHPRNPIKTLRDQANGSWIATGSLRRKCQLLHTRPDLRIVDVRGNLKTRVKKLEESNWAGMILARAGIVRLGWQALIGETLSPDVMVPAVGQGALAIEIRDNDIRVKSHVLPLHHELTARCVLAERALLHRLEGGCQVPIGAFARQNGDDRNSIRCDAIVGSLDGTKIVRGSITGAASASEDLGDSLAGRLLAEGAGEILEGIRRAPLDAKKNIDHADLRPGGVEFTEP